MLLTRHIRLALGSLRRSKWRSFLTMLGIIIGVASVVTTVSLGEGVRQEITGQIKNLGPDLITVQPPATKKHGENGQLGGLTLLPSVVPSSLTLKDVQTIQHVPGVRQAVPLGLVAGLPTSDGREYDSGLIVATTPEAPEMLNQKVQFGTFFGDEDADKYVAVIGKNVAEELFHELVPVGKSFDMGGQTYIVRGIFDEFQNSPLSLTVDFNTAIFIPYNIGRQATGGTMQLYQIMVRPTPHTAGPALQRSITAAVKANHAGQQDFSVLNANESLAAANTILNLLTGMIAGIAAISLVVGGIGIMNIMLASVIERTREIGIRKSVGATNRQILSQFLTEALVLSVMGGIIGVLLSILLNYIIRVTTNLEPVVTWPIMAISVSVALVVGVIFGIAPAAKAAHKDPIEALRYE